jgi:hypothetical protein
MRVLYKDKDGSLLFRKSFCAYIDILGFSEKVIENDLEFFKLYLNTLKDELLHIEDIHDLSGKQGFKSFELKIFTDNFVFGHPWFDRYGESELGDIFEILSHIQLTFVKSNIFVRGAISMSDLYMDENIVLGPAIIESYNLESEKSIYPRIILSKDIVEVVNEHINYYADHSSSPQSKEYLIDIDGFHFVNYLYILFYDMVYPNEIVIKELLLHRKAIEENLKLYKDNFKLFDKYAWSANYHNYFCEYFVKPRIPEINLETIKIVDSLFAKTIKGLV